MVLNEAARGALERIGLHVIDIGEGRRGRFIADVPMDCTHGHSHDTESGAWDDAVSHLNQMLHPVLEDLLDHGHEVRFLGTDERTIHIDGQEVGKAKDAAEALAAAWRERFGVQ